MTTTLSELEQRPEYGSAEKTSSAAAATLPERGARRAGPSSSTSSPRGARSRSGRRRASWRRRSASIEPRVSSVSGRCSVRKSAAARTLVHASRPGRRRARGSAPSRTNGSYATTRHLEPARAARDLLADAPEAENAERLPRELEPAVARALPAAVLERRVCLRGCSARARAAGRSVCSAAEMTVDSGAFATTIPRRVAASTSTLSTPTPARPITFSRSALLDQIGASSFVAERITIAVVARRSSPRESPFASTSTSKRSRKQLEPGLGDRLADQDSSRLTAACLVRLERARDRDAALDVRTEPRRVRARSRRARS